MTVCLRADASTAMADLASQQHLSARLAPQRNDAICDDGLVPPIIPDNPLAVVTGIIKIDVEICWEWEGI
jgi:hypothetical protein